MHIDSSGWLKESTHLCSPHYDERPLHQIITMIVIHGISLPPGQFGNGMIEKLFCGELDINLDPYFATIPSLRVASHLLISRAGKITQFVPFSKRAWHAGESVFQGQINCNDFSIGIELEGTDDLAYENVQYLQLSCVIRALMRKYSAISRERIVGHNIIAPRRKTDPGAAFDWNRLDHLLYRFL